MLILEDAPEYGAYLLARVPGAQPAHDAFRAVRGALGKRVGVLGGVATSGTERRFGWMLAPAPSSPLGFELVSVVANVGEAGVDPLMRGAIDVPAAGATLVARDLVDDPLPNDPVVALAELAQRARERGREVICLPSFAWTVVADEDDRGRLTALRAFAGRHPTLEPTFRRPPGVRARFIDRDVRLAGGRHVRVARRRPSLTVAGSLEALDAALRVRGDRYVLVAGGNRVPPDEVVDALVERIEDDANVALAAPDVSSLDGSCVLLHAGRFPQHVITRATTLDEAIDSLVGAARALRRGVRVPGLSPAVAAAPPHDGTLTVVLLVGSAPEITRMTLDAVLAQVVAGERVQAILPSGAETARRALVAYPQVAISDDPADPLLTGAANCALGQVSTPLVALVADDVLLSRNTLAALRRAFAEIPVLGAASPIVTGAAGQESAYEDYPDIAAFEKLAERRGKERAREREPIDDASTPALLIARDALQAVGGIDPMLGPTRRGIADLVLRLRAAGYAVVRCEDAFAHRFKAEQSHNVAAYVDRSANVWTVDLAATIDAGFDPARVVPFATADAEERAGTEARVAVALPVASASELERAATIVAAASRVYDVRAPLRLHVLLDGVIEPAAAAARLRPVLAESGRTMASTVAVRVERQADLTAWRAALEGTTRVVTVSDLRREALADVPQLATHSIARVLEDNAS